MSSQRPLSSPEYTSSVPTAFDPDELKVLRAVADALLPGDGNHPRASDLEDFDQLLRKAAGARFEDRDRLTSSLDWISSNPVDLASLKNFADANPLGFQLLSAVVVGAYTMAAEVREALGYQGQVRNVPGAEEAIDELSDGILDQVIGRGPIFVQPAE